MLNKNYTYTFTLMIFTGTLISVSATSWLVAWLGLEINLMSFIPIILFKNHAKSIDSSIKYFIIQALSSSLIIFSSLIQLALKSYFFLFNFISLIFLALLIKLAAAPFHMWFPQLAESFNWPQFIITISWQKIAPLWLMANLKTSFFIIFILIISTIMGSLTGVNMNSIKQILIFSSISQSSWLISAIYMNKYIWMIYFCIYMFMVTILSVFSISCGLQFTNHISLKTMNPFNKINFILSILSIASIPPLLGFFSKLLVIQFMLMFWKNLSLIISLMGAALISLFFYLKMILSMILMPYFFKTYNQSLTTTNYVLMIMNLMGNTMAPLFLIM